MSNAKPMKRTWIHDLTHEHYVIEKSGVAHIEWYRRYLSSRVELEVTVATSPPATYKFSCQPGDVVELAQLGDPDAIDQFLTDMGLERIR